MPRQARIILPGYPYRVTQRGNRRQQTFFDDENYALYRDLMAAACAQFRVRCWAWSSARYHVTGAPDGLTMAVDYLTRIPDWPTYLADGLRAQEEARLGYFTQTGYPMGAAAWLCGLETKSGRRLRPKPRGRPSVGAG